MEILNVVKVGGALINDKNLLNKFLVKFADLQGLKILVHGGGRNATEISQKLGIEPRVIDGRRITDDATLDVVVMVYAGLVNKKIIAALQAKDVNAIGLTGADLNIIKAHKRIHSTLDFGKVGDIDSVNDLSLKRLISENIVPVICPITHDNNGQLFNTNADTIAANVSKAMSKHYNVTLKYCFEHSGVMLDLENTTSTIAKLDDQLYDKLKQQGHIHSGMIPKLDNAFFAKNNGVNNVAICGIHNLVNENNLTWIC